MLSLDLKGVLSKYNYKILNYKALIPNSLIAFLPLTSLQPVSHQPNCAETCSLLTPDFTYGLISFYLHYSLHSHLLVMSPLKHILNLLYFHFGQHLRKMNPVSLLLCRGIKRLIELPLNFVNEKTRFHWPKGLQQVTKHSRQKIWVLVCHLIQVRKEIFQKVHLLYWWMGYNY